MLKYKAKEMPCIKASSFAFEFVDEEGHLRRRPYRKWKLVPLTVEDFDLCETQFDRFSSFGLESDGENTDGKETTLSRMTGKCPIHDTKDIALGDTRLGCSSDLFQLSLD